jgi:hypothetical protein
MPSGIARHRRILADRRRPTVRFRDQSARRETPLSACSRPLVCGNPWSRRSGGPEPPVRTWMLGPDAGRGVSENRQQIPSGSRARVMRPRWRPTWPPTSGLHVANHPLFSCPVARPNGQMFTRALGEGGRIPPLRQPSRTLADVRVSYGCKPASENPARDLAHSRDEIRRSGEAAKGGRISPQDSRYGRLSSRLTPVDIAKVSGYTHMQCPKVKRKASGGSKCCRARSI